MVSSCQTFPTNTVCYVSLSLRSATAWSRVTTVVSSHEGGSPFCNVTSPTGGQHGSAASSFSISLYLFLGILFLRIAFPHRFKALLGTIKDCRNKNKTYQLIRVYLYSSLFSINILRYEACIGIAFYVTSRMNAAKKFAPTTPNSINLNQKAPSGITFN